jgi:LysR family transcriptional regulator, glycine cleavage system transcriptional activator
MLKRVSIKAIQVFEAAARLSSFELAAQELFVTPSAISHQIKLLEEQFGVRLFHRVHRAVTLTDAGRRYGEEVSAALGRIELATRELGLTAKSDILTINSAPSFATQWLMPRLARFSALNPDIDVRLNTSYPPTDMILETVDIDIRYGMRKQVPSDAIVLTLPAETIVPLCAPALAGSKHPIRSPEDLRHHVLIHDELCLVGWHDWMRLHFNVQLDTSRGYRFNRAFMAISTAVDGLGVCLESLLLVQRELKTNRLVAPLGFDGMKVQGYTFNILKSRAELPKIRNFQVWLFAELEKMSVM